MILVLPMGVERSPFHPAPGVGRGGPRGGDLGPGGESHGCAEGGGGWRWRGSATGKGPDIPWKSRMLKLFWTNKDVGNPCVLDFWCRKCMKMMVPGCWGSKNGRTTVEKLENVRNMGEEPDGKLRINWIFTAFELGKFAGAQPNWGDSLPENGGGWSVADQIVWEPIWPRFTGFIIIDPFFTRKQQTLWVPTCDKMLGIY